MMSQS